MTAQISSTRPGSPWLRRHRLTLGLAAVAAAVAQPAFALRLDVVVADIAATTITSACNSHDSLGSCFIWKHVWHLDGDLQPIVVPTPRFGDDPACRIGVRHNADYAFATIDCGSQVTTAHTEAICGGRPVAWLSYTIEDDGVPEHRVGYDVTVTCR